MNNRPIPTLLWFITALPFVYLAYRYPGLPEIVPIHYGPDGAADAWAQKAWLWLMPVAPDHQTTRLPKLHLHRILYLNSQ